ncbi:DUF6261 family protein [Flavobacterium sp.]|uniref:DUF6261 family protein n=1 Tax=Flavobacterium sp. TaxID=239 RepID=UPI0025F29800|nr:DUF6261 family protein [Flavobacterium sp.]
MINAINISILRNAEYLQFMKNVASLVQANDPLVLNVATQYNDLNNAISVLDGLFKTRVASEITEELVLIDERRDNAITGLGFVVSGYLYHYDAVLAQAANVLNDNLKLYGSSIAKQNYQAATATINSIANDWETKPALIDAVNTLQLKSWKDELKAANVLFDERYLARTQEYGAANPDTIKAKREETNGVYYTLRDFLNSFSIVQPSAANTKTGNEINALVEQYNTLLINRLANGVEETPTP